MVDAKKPARIQTPKAPDPEMQNEGEGSRSAARRYDEGASKMAASGKVEKLAQEAVQALDGQEGAALREAEKKGKKAQLPLKRR